MHWFCVLLVFIVSSLNAGEIVVTSDFALIEKEVEKLDSDSLVLFDVDATLIVPDDSILKPKGKDLFKRLIAKYRDRDLFREIRLKASHSLVDARSIMLTQKLKLKNIPVIAFTAAPAKIKGREHPGDWRIDELRQHGFDFSYSFTNHNFLELPKSIDQLHFPLLKSGVLFSSFHPKGDLLVLFLRLIGLNPKKVIFVDDELNHVKSVVAALDKQGIVCIGIYYTAANEMPCALDCEQASFQIQYFVEHDVWLNDKASKDLINKTVDLQKVAKEPGFLSHVPRWLSWQ